MTNTVRFAAALLLLPACLAQAATELVMREGTSVTARQGDSAITIIAGKKYDRTYQWNGCSLKSNMAARKQRWFGSMGIADGAFSLGLLSKPCDGISRTVVEEGQIHFDDTRFAMEWIRRQQLAYEHSVWTSDGLMISWDTVPAREQLNVEVWMMCTQGKPLRDLAGADDSAIEVTANSSGQTRYECATVDQAVVNQTRQQLEEHWSSVEQWKAKMKQRPAGAK